MLIKTKSSFPFFLCVCPASFTSANLLEKTLVHMASLSARSHFTNATYLAAPTFTRHPAQEVMTNFYSKLLPKARLNPSTDFSKRCAILTKDVPCNEMECDDMEGVAARIRSPCPSPFAKHLPAWVPHVGLTPESLKESLVNGELMLEKSLSLPPELEARGLTLVKTPPVHSVPAELAGGPKGVMSTAHLRFFADTASTGKPLYSDKGTAPFEVQPSAEEGALNWMDIPVPKGAELGTVKQMCRSLGMKLAAPIKMPGDLGLYITLLNNTGKYENRHKLAGCLPSNLILTDFTNGFPEDVTSLCFFAVESAARVDELALEIPKLGGWVPGPNINADGRVCLARDPNGAHFALYARSDEGGWDSVKGTTQPPKFDMDGNLVVD